MAAKFFSKRNLDFLLFEVFKFEELTAHSYYKQHNRNIVQMVLEAAIQLSKNIFHPVLQEMDRIPPELNNGQVKVNPAVRKIMTEAGNGGWIGLNFPLEFGGEQLPHIVSAGCRFIFSAANYSAAVYPELTAGAARLITSFGNEHLVSTYVHKMLKGKWQGTMALTEPQAGSSLADIMTSATLTRKGHYLIKGHKIFISAGDHDGVENIVHLMLGRIKGAPAGVNGISLFVVPKNRIDSKGELVPNDITVTQIFHKLGYRGTPITELSMGEKDDCHGYLLGEPHKGLSYMFQMMNEFRLSVGLGAAAIASAAYHAALDYAKKRSQGRHVSQKEISLPQVPIIEHADVKRMLLFQKAIVEGSLSLNMQCCRYADMAILTTGKDHHHYHLLIDILTPVAKSYPSEMGILSTSQALQCLGGYGYCDDFPIEQYYRDVRIHPIHEGTTGIQGMDLLGRKVRMEDGKAFYLYLSAVKKTIRQAEAHKRLKPQALTLKSAIKHLEAVTRYKINLLIEKGSEVFLADATLYLEYFGIIAIAWQWLKQAVSACFAIEKRPSRKNSNFYQGKLFTFNYFFSYELPKILGLHERLMDDSIVTMDMTSAFFTDN